MEKITLSVVQDIGERIAINISCDMEAIIEKHKVQIKKEIGEELKDYNLEHMGTEIFDEISEIIENEICTESGDIQIGINNVVYNCLKEKIEHSKIM